MCLCVKSITSDLNDLSYLQFACCFILTYTTVSFESYIQRIDTTIKFVEHEGTGSHSKIPNKPLNTFNIRPIVVVLNFFGEEITMRFKVT